MLPTSEWCYGGDASGVSDDACYAAFLNMKKKKML